VNALAQQDELAKQTHAEKAKAVKLGAAETLSHQGPIQRLTNMLPLTRSTENQILRDTAEGKDVQPQPAPHGQTVIQNGHTYTWNQATGQYE
jgi:hypothetical protein